MNKQKLKTLKEYSIIVICAILLELNYEIFVWSNRFAPSGMNGLATIIQDLIKKVFDVHFNAVGYMNLLINIPLVVAAYFLLNKEYAIKTLTYVLVFTAATFAFKYVDLSRFIYHTETGTSTILGPVFGGIMSGLTIGVLFKINSSTAGTDIVAALIRKKKPYFNIVWIIFALNVLIAISSYFVYDFKIEPVLCCFIYAYASSKMSDMILKGGKEAIKFEVVTNNPEEISKAIISQLHHSVTLIHATGMYSHLDKSLLICVVNKHQIMDFQNILKKFPDTFAYISTVNETMGNFIDSSHKK